MAFSAFMDKTKKPRETELKQVLGRVSGHWDFIVAHIAADYAPLDQTWMCSGAKWGWALRLKQKKRTVLYLTPHKGSFTVGFALGERAVTAAHEKGLPAAVLDLIDNSQKFAEGRAVRLEVKRKADRDNVLKIAAIKMAN